MTVRQHRLSTVPEEAEYVYPSDKDYPLNEDWEAGPVALLDTSLGLFNQAWHLTYAANAFTVTPEDTGPPVLLDLGSPVNSVQCGLAFDQNAHVTIVWVDSFNSGHLYWFDTTEGDWVITDFQNPVAGVGLTLDDKRFRQTGASDILLWYTLAIDGHHEINTREQRDRFAVPYPMEPVLAVWPYFKKLGMHKELRVQMTMTNVGPV